MKFIKIITGSFLGFILAAVILTAVGACSAGVLIAVLCSGESGSVEDNSVLVLPLDGTFAERSSEDVLSELTGEGTSTVGLDQYLMAIKEAKTNDKVKGIYIEAGELDAGSAMLKELRDALIDFKTSGKWVYSYADEYTQAAYYVCSVADSIYLNPQGELDLHGVGIQSMFVKDLFAKLGIEYQVTKVGTYKSATEAYTETSMSAANREQYQRYIDGLWATVTGEISASRGISSEQLNELADGLTIFEDQQRLVELGLVDGLLYSDEIRAKVAARLGEKKAKDIKQVDVATLSECGKQNAESGKGKVAIYYAEGDIVDSASSGVLSGGESEIVGNTVCADIDKLIADEDVKAVVLRINSGGGSAYASEQMWHRIEMLKAAKPVVVSMSDYAASGGYYMSCNANWIVAEPTTLTGSIGIFGLMPVAQDLLENKLGLHFDGVKTNKHTDAMSNTYGLLNRALDAEEQAILQRYINRGYALFRQRVADGRGLSVEQVEAIAQGRIWLGTDALEIGLVDELGGLDQAVAKAAELADLKEYSIAQYPEAGDWWEELLDWSSSGSSNYLNEYLGTWARPLKALKSAERQGHVQAVTGCYVTW